MGDPLDPSKGLPKGAPDDLRAFLECKGASVTFKDGSLPWLSLSGVVPDDLKDFVPAGAAPSLSITAGPGAGATIGISVGDVSVASVPASISNGQLSVDTSGLHIPGVADALNREVDNLNAWFKAHGKGLGAAVVGKGQVTLKKVDLAVPAANPQPPAPAVPVPGAPKATPKPAGPPAGAPAKSSSPGATAPEGFDDGLPDLAALHASIQSAVAGIDDGSLSGAEAKATLDRLDAEFMAAMRTLHDATGTHDMLPFEPSSQMQIDLKALSGARKKLDRRTDSSYPAPGSTVATTATLGSTASLPPPQTVGTSGDDAGPAATVASADDDLGFTTPTGESVPVPKPGEPGYPSAGDDLPSRLTDGGPPGPGPEDLPWVDMTESGHERRQRTLRRFSEAAFAVALLTIVGLLLITGISPFRQGGTASSSASPNPIGVSVPGGSVAPSTVPVTSPATVPGTGSSVPQASPPTASGAFSLVLIPTNEGGLIGTDLCKSGGSIRYTWAFLGIAPGTEVVVRISGPGLHQTVTFLADPGKQVVRTFPIPPGGGEWTEQVVTIGGKAPPTSGSTGMNPVQC